MSGEREDGLSRLLTPLLLAADRSPASESTGGSALAPTAVPWDAEAAAQFVAGELSAAEAEAFLAGLDGDPAARETVAHLLGSPQLETAGVSWRAPLPPPVSYCGPWRVWAVAAALLCAAGAFVFLRPAARRGESVAAVREAILQDLRAGEFQQAELRWRAALADSSADSASDPTVASQLQSLGAPIALRLPGPVSLQLQGVLTDYGYQLGGVAPRGAVDGELGDRAQAALDALEGATGVEAALNRGQALLLLQRPTAAGAAFLEALRLDPDSPDAELGAGISAFEESRFEAAVRHFRRAWRLQPDRAAARINLAMALEECGEFREAWTLWQSLAVEEAPPPLRRQLELHLPELQRHLEAPP